MTIKPQKYPTSWVLRSMGNFEIRLAEEESLIIVPSLNTTLGHGRVINRPTYTS